MLDAALRSIKTLRTIRERSTQHTETASDESTGDFLSASDISVEDGTSYEIVTSRRATLRCPRPRSITAF